MNASAGEATAFVREQLLARTLNAAAGWTGWVGHGLAGGLVAWLGWGSGSAALLGGWLLVLGLAICAELFLARRLIRDANLSAQERSLTLTGMQFVLAIVWALAMLYVGFGAQRELYLPVAILLGGLCIIAVGTTHTHLPACIAFIAPVAVASVAAGLANGSWLPAIVAGLFALALLRLALLLNTFLRNMLTLHFERDVLLEQLTRQAGELDAANAAKSRFLAQASHDLRQPMHAIGLFVETLSGLPADSHVTTIVDRVRKSVAMMSRLFDSLLDTSLLDTGQVATRMGVVSLNDTFTQLARDFAPAAEAEQVGLRFVPTRVSVESDAVLLHRMIQNLVANALRYADHSVLVGVRREAGGEDRVSVVVYDDGCGIAEADQDLIFEEFGRVEDERVTAVGAENAAGLGLGLSIVSRLARLLGLTIEVVSEPGRGSCFRIGGLQRTSQSVAQVGLVHDEPDDVFAGMEVLVIDDDAQTREATAVLLQRWGCRVTTQTAPPIEIDCDVLICDYALAEGTDGLAVIAAARQARTEPLPAILITGDAAPDCRHRAAELTVPLLYKPVRPAQLKSVLLSVTS